MKVGCRADELDEYRCDQYLPYGVRGSAIVTEWKPKRVSCITRGSGNKPFGTSTGSGSLPGCEGESAVSLRTALASLPDDRMTASAVREVIAFFAAHAHTPLDPSRISRATSLSSDRVVSVVKALCSAGVLHCDGDPDLKGSTFDPDRVLSMEVDRFLRSGGATSARLQAGVGRYMNRFGHT